MQAHEGLRYRGQAPLHRVPLLAASETEEEPARAAAAAAPPAGPPSRPSTPEWLKSAYDAVAGAAAPRASADPAEDAAVANRRRTWAGVARSRGAAVRDPADYMRRSMYNSADALLQAKGKTLLPAHFAMLQHHPRFRRSAECASARAKRFGPKEPLLLPFARFAPADVALLLRWTYKKPEDRRFGRDGATQEEFKALAALFVEDNQATAWWRKAGEVEALGGASGA
jgi:hypothetical protein